VMAFSNVLGFRVAEVPCEFVRRADKRSSVRLFRSTIQQTRELVAFALVLRRRRGEWSALRRSEKVLEPLRTNSLASEHSYRLAVGRFVEVVRGPVVSREIAEGLRIEPLLDSSTTGIRQKGRDLLDRPEAV
jgi:hypothetical protein